MNAQVGIEDLQTKASPAQLSCSACPAFELNICHAVSEAAWAYARPEPHSLTQSDLKVPARRIIFREHDLQDAVPVICVGWAASAIMLSDGSRQIISFLLPGDIVSTALLFESRPNCFVEAITDVRYRTFKRSELKDILFRHPDLMEKMSKAWIEEKNRADQLIVDLGRRTADERIARLILNLMDRLIKRNMVQGGPLEFEFPLRQHHIADATGLTPVHVSKVLSEFRRGGLIKLSERSLTILDPAGFRRIANKR
jgi:CRP-like cAMP-binding protein